MKSTVNPSLNWFKQRASSRLIKPGEVPLKLKAGRDFTLQQGW